jgi:hypothetical protein
MRIAEVTWLDAHGHPGFMDADEMRSHHVAREVRSVGYVFKETSEGITLAGCTDDSREFDRHLFVPRAMMKMVVWLRE